MACFHFSYLHSTLSHQFPAFALQKVGFPHPCQIGILHYVSWHYMLFLILHCYQLLLHCETLPASSFPFLHSSISPNLRDVARRSEAEDPNCVMTWSNLIRSFRILI